MRKDNKKNNFTKERPKLASSPKFYEPVVGQKKLRNEKREKNKADDNRDDRGFRRTYRSDESREYRPFDKNRSYYDQNRRSFNSNDDRSDDRRPYQRDDRDTRGGNDRGGFERKPFNRDDRSDDRRPYQRDDRDTRSGNDRGAFERKPYQRNNDRSDDRRPYQRDDRDTRSGNDRGAFERKPFNRDDRSDDRRPYQRDDRDTRGGNDRGGFERKPYQRDNDRSDDRRPYQRDDRDTRGGNDRGGFERKPYQRDNDRSDDRRPYQRDDRDTRGGNDRGGFERKPFNRDDRSDDRRPYQRDDRDARGGNDRGGFERKPYQRDNERSDNRREDTDKSADKKIYKGFGELRTRNNQPTNFERTPFGEKQHREKGASNKTPFLRDLGGDERPNRGFSYQKDGEEKEEREVRKPRKQAPNTAPKAKEEDDMRLNKYVALCGVASRRAAGEIIKKGEISVNGAVEVEPGKRILPEDVVTYKGKKLDITSKLVYLIMNKPKGFITTTNDELDRKTVMDLIDSNIGERIFPVGRLDRETVGLLLFTNDGDIAQKLTHPSNKVKKIYHVKLDKPLTKRDAEQITEGLMLEDGKAEVDGLSIIEDSNNKEVGIEIHIGKNRIVRRIFEHLGYGIEKLDRVYYAGLTKKDIPRGRYRHLTEREVIMLKHFS
jgi:23S rRNA pseudouridine2605 synthase